MKILQRLFCLQALFRLAAVIVFFTFLGGSGHALEWFDDWSNLNATDPVAWTPQPATPGDYDASSGDYILTPTDEGLAGPVAEPLASMVETHTFTDTSVRTQAKVGFSDIPKTNENADFDASDLVTGSDFLIWQRGAGGPGTQPEGDADISGQIDGADLTIWQDQFGDPPNEQTGNVGIMARFDTTAGNGYFAVIDQNNVWTLTVIEGFQEAAKLNEGPDEDRPPIDPDTGDPLNASSDIMIQLDVTGAGSDTLLEVWIWKPGEPMPIEPHFSVVDEFNGTGGNALINEGVAGVFLRRRQ